MRKLSTIAAVLATLGTATTSYVMAEGKPATSAADIAAQLKTVTPVSEEEQLLEFYIKQRAGKHYRSVTPEQRAALAVELKRNQMLARYADKNNTLDAATKAAINIGTITMKAQSAAVAYLAANPTPEADIRALYAERAPGYAKDKYEASHILLEKEETAKALIAKLATGADFAELAKKNSVDTVSGEQGGKLGSFTADEMVPAFSEALKTMKAGETSQQPVKSSFGFHIIHLVTVTQSKPPTFEALEPTLKNELDGKRLQAWIEKLVPTK